MSKRVRACSQCGKTKDRQAFGIVDGKRLQVCDICYAPPIPDAEVEVDATFQAEIYNMGADFVPVEELEKQFEE